MPKPCGFFQNSRWPPINNQPRASNLVSIMFGDKKSIFMVYFMVRYSIHPKLMKLQKNTSNDMG